MEAVKVNDGRRIAQLIKQGYTLISASFGDHHAKLYYMRGAVS